VEPGVKEFKSYCSACHQYDDQGMGEAPPLDRSPWVTGPEERLIRIVLHGVRGPIEVHGKTYNREMPGFGQILSNDEIAALLSFVRKRFGESSAPILATSVERVRAASPGRTEYWSVEELLAEP
jgi:mono/diheme cytochrome c family protein